MSGVPSGKTHPCLERCPNVRLSHYNPLLCRQSPAERKTDNKSPLLNQSYIEIQAGQEQEKWWISQILHILPQAVIKRETQVLILLTAFHILSSLGKPQKYRPLPSSILFSLHVLLPPNVNCFVCLQLIMKSCVAIIIPVPISCSSFH